ncbi:MAG: hypothetical protein N2512_05045 [Armatimonadetes bacterium]|nr:hypothetical protein [Armatimonadota bacterium]
MPKLVVVSILLVVVLGYAMAFVSWNSTPVSVVGFRWGNEAFWETIPVAYLPLAGIGIGVVAMALASLSQWSASRGQLKKLSSQVQKAREVIEFQKKRIAELEAALERLQASQAATTLEPPDQPPEQLSQAPEEENLEIELVGAGEEPTAPAESITADSDDAEVI